MNVSNARISAAAGSNACEIGRSVGIVEKPAGNLFEPDFPKDGKPLEKLLFAIRHHCAAEGTKEFHIGARDAALLTGLHWTNGARLAGQAREERRA